MSSLSLANDDHDIDYYVDRPPEDELEWAASSAAAVNQHDRDLMQRIGGAMNRAPSKPVVVSHPSLLAQGCIDPSAHYHQGHSCRIPALRIKCGLQIKRWWRYRPVIRAIAEQLPDEICLLILEHVASIDQPRLHLHAARHLTKAARNLVGEACHAESADKLIPIAEQAILLRTTILFQVDFRQATAQTKAAVLPAWVARLPHQVHHFELHVQTDFPGGSPIYPLETYQATATMPSLSSQLVRLRSLRIVLCCKVCGRTLVEGRGRVLDHACRQGFSGLTSFRQAIVDLLEAARAATGKNTRIVLEMAYERRETSCVPYRSPPGELGVELGDRPPLDVVNEAVAKHH